MGFPTANIEADAALDARDGVYASRVEVDGRMYDAMSNLGYKPTVDGRRRLLETNIFGFEGDLYGRRLRVELLRFIRPERRFGSVEELFRQIRKLTAAGVSILYISHRLQEVAEIGDRVFVMRDGAYVDTVPAKTTARDDLIKMMVGREIGDLFPKLLHLCIIAVELFLDLVQKTVHVLCAVAAEVLLELHRTYILRSQHSNFLPLFNIEKTR